MSTGMKNMTAFDPSRLAAVLAEKRVTQAELARQVGFAHRNVVHKIIRGTREATATDLLRISTALGTSPEEFAARV